MLLADSSHRHFLHSLMICEVLASLDLGIRARPGLRLIGWQEILGRAPEATRSSPTPFRIPRPSGGSVIPDGLFGIEYRSGNKNSYRFFALEADRGTMPVVRSNPEQTSHLGKISAYREILERRAYKTHWGIPNLLVLTVTTSEARMAGMLNRLGEQDGSHAAILFKAVTRDALRQPMTQILTEPWRRAALPPLDVGESD